MFLKAMLNSDIVYGERKNRTPQALQDGTISAQWTLLAAPLQLSQEPRFRKRNTRIYRLAHWPIWFFVFMIAPGKLVVELFTRGFDWRMFVWFVMVVAATGVAGWRGYLPGTEPRPYILRFTENKPNPLYRRVCYTIAWGNLLTFTMLNLTVLVDSAVTGKWHFRQIYGSAYLVPAVVVWSFGALGWLPRTRPSTQGESRERRYFYAMVWAVGAAHALTGLFWKLLPRTRQTNIVDLAVFTCTLVGVGVLALIGRLPRTQPIAYPEWAVSD
jgi:hypothetical protein